MSEYQYGGRGGGAQVDKFQLMDQIKQEIAVANAKELIHV